MKISDDEKAALRRQHSGPGHHYFTCCAVCGFVEWRMTQTKAPDDVTVDESSYDWQSNRGCVRCTEVASREPEVYRWVLAVIGYQKRKAEEAAPPPEQVGGQR